MTRLTPTAVRLLRMLKLEDRDGRLARATNDQLADLLGVTARSVTTALTRLVDAGLLRIETRRGHPAADKSARTLRLVPTPEGEPTESCVSTDTPGTMIPTTEPAADGREAGRPRPQHQAGVSPAMGSEPDAISFHMKGVA